MKKNFLLTLLLGVALIINASAQTPDHRPKHVSKSNAKVDKNLDRILDWIDVASKHIIDPKNYKDTFNKYTDTNTKFITAKGVEYSRDGFINFYDASIFKLNNYKVLDEKINIISHHSAVVTRLIEIDLQINNVSVAPKQKVSYVFSKINGQWKLLLRHSTAVN